MSEQDPRADIPYRIDSRRSTWPEAIRLVVLGSPIVFAILAGWDRTLERPLDLIEYGVKAIAITALMALAMRIFPLTADNP